MAGCGNDEPEKADVDQPKETVTVEAEEPDVELGDYLEVTGKGTAQVNVAANEVLEDPQVDELSQPKAGERVVAVKFVIDNQDFISYPESSLSAAQLVDSEGNEYEPNFIVQSLAEGELLPADFELEPEGKLAGYVPFTIPAEAQVAKVRWIPKAGTGDAVEWPVS